MHMIARKERSRKDLLSPKAVESYVIMCHLAISWGYHGGFPTPLLISFWNKLFVKTHKLCEALGQSEKQPTPLGLLAKY